MRPRTPRRDPAKPTEITVAEAKAQMLAFLYGCQPPQLAAATVDNLVRWYRVDRNTAEAALTVARAVREAE